MAEGISIDAEVLRGAAPAFGSAGFELRQALGTLRDTLRGLGEPWGDDSQGREFGASFAANRDKLDRALDVLARGLSSIDDGLRAIVDNTGGADRASAVHGE
jgi:uncharacterized protein YukE